MNQTLNRNASTTHKPPDPDDRPIVDCTDIFHLLGNERRCRVVHQLEEHDGDVAFRALVDEITAVEFGHEPDDLDGEDRQSVYVSLYQTHIPKLGEEDIISYDRVTGTIQKGDLFHLARRHLKLSAEYSDSA